MQLSPDSPHWHSDIETALIVNEPAAINWEVEKDVIIVGLGGAGVACALQSLEVTALKAGAPPALRAVLFMPAEVHQSKKLQASKMMSKICSTILNSKPAILFQMKPCGIFAIKAPRPLNG